DETNSILTLCRMILTMDTGKIIPKDIAGNAVAAT
ncbi:aminoglycoside nucleotidyltransferase ANT9, partial [Klebsiella pneumoniae]